ncbi:hypothetical protein Q3C01_20005 [Bradyrhizobium sp. UFLA05-109]
MLDVLVRDAVIVQERDVRVRGLGTLQHREHQCSERQYSEPARMDPAANAPDRGFEREGTALGRPAGNESKGAFGYREQGRTRGAVEIADEFAQLHASVAGEVENGVVNEADADLPVGGSLDHVTEAEWIANHDLGGDAARTPQDAATDRRVNGADYLRRRDHGGHVSGLNAGRN